MKIMKTKTNKSKQNNSKNLRLFFSPSWTSHGKDVFSISSGRYSLKLGGKEARMIHSFLNKVY